MRHLTRRALVLPFVAASLALGAPTAAHAGFDPAINVAASGADPFGYPSDIGFDQSGATTVETVSGGQVLVFRRPAGGSFSGGSIGSGTKASLAVSADGSAVTVWRESATSVKVAYRPNSGAAFAAAATFTGTAVGKVAAGIDSTGGAVVAWKDGGIHYALSSGATFGTAQDATTLGASPGFEGRGSDAQRDHGPRAFRDDAGNVTLVYRDGNNATLAHRTTTGTWTSAVLPGGATTDVQADADPATHRLMVGYSLAGSFRAFEGSTTGTTGTVQVDQPASGDIFSVAVQRGGSEDLALWRGADNSLRSAGSVDGFTPATVAPSVGGGAYAGVTSNSGSVAYFAASDGFGRACREPGGNWVNAPHVLSNFGTAAGGTGYGGQALGLFVDYPGDTAITGFPYSPGCAGAATPSDGGAGQAYLGALATARAGTQPSNDCSVTGTTRSSDGSEAVKVKSAGAAQVQVQETPVKWPTFVAPDHKVWAVPPAVLPLVTASSKAHLRQAEAHGWKVGSDHGQSGWLRDPAHGNKLVYREFGERVGGSHGGSAARAARRIKHPRLTRRRVRRRVGLVHASRVNVPRTGTHYVVVKLTGRGKRLLTKPKHRKRRHAKSKKRRHAKGSATAAATVPTPGVKDAVKVTCAPVAYPAVAVTPAPVKVQPTPGAPYVQVQPTIPAVSCPCTVVPNANEPAKVVLGGGVSKPPSSTPAGAASVTVAAPAPPPAKPAVSVFDAQGNAFEGFGPASARPYSVGFPVIAGVSVPGLAATVTESCVTVSNSAVVGTSGSSTLRRSVVDLSQAMPLAQGANFSAAPSTSSAGAYSRVQVSGSSSAGQASVRVFRSEVFGSAANTTNCVADTSSVAGLSKADASGHNVTCGAGKCDVHGSVAHPQATFGDGRSVALP